MHQECLTSSDPCARCQHAADTDARGWLVVTSGRGIEIQRDDELAIYPDDDAAFAAARREAYSGDAYAIAAICAVVHACMP